ncbi:conjugal transfer protein TraI [Chitinophaga niabensis]|uniref:Conjugal transfer protein TraI n=1 Tax=Chitinophaga niabensis TaxID=536979 RepID=A0A1N6E4R2_9BACT|nr:conjugal transfer protein TraI [Chitinophaga niabensis]SIN78045.1 hypothetical protein SAMN04488055_1304 [Chitinophaga niabensis]
MKRWGLVILLMTAMVIAPTQKSHAIWWLVVKAAVKKAIKAADLAIQRQQNKVIWLQNAQKVIENTMSKLKLTEISDWTARQRNLYKEYFEELNKVKLLITYYQRIREITAMQIALVEEYKQAWRQIRNDKHFTPQEIIDIGRYYDGILNETIQNLEQLGMVINSFKTQMSDAKRLMIINQVADQVEQNFTDLRRFTASNKSESLKRAHSLQEIETVKMMYGLERK